MPFFLLKLSWTKTMNEWMNIKTVKSKKKMKTKIIKNLIKQNNKFLFEN